MNRLDMIKAFARLEGVCNFNEHCDKIFVRDIEKGTVYINGYSHSRYNPIDDFELNCKARDKYHVEIDYDTRECSIYDDNESLLSIASVFFHSSGDVNISVIECILKSKGLWV